MKYFIESSAVFAILACILGLYISWKNFFRNSNSSKAYEQALARTKWLDFCGFFIRQKDSLLMKNTGDDPNKVREPIPYVNYIQDLSLFY